MACGFQANKKKVLVIGLLVLVLVGILVGLLVYFLNRSPNEQSHQEQYRLQVHYSVPSGWANDPNGLIYFDGYYHLFFQHNPESTKFGAMHWGHARSNDLIHWETLPIALKPTEKGLIFSGCCIHDKDNVTGIVPDSLNIQGGPLIAMYTVHHDESWTETQEMSYSFDSGTTWTEYKANPVIPNPGIYDFRDPNIFERNGMYYMTLTHGDCIGFHVSVDLKSWEWLGDFGVSPDEGDKSGVWECPALITLKDDDGKEHDILIVSLNNEDSGSITQYFIGQFDGVRYSTYDQTKLLWVDNGFDNYAAIPFNNEPLGRIVLIGWLSNWLYAQDIPTSAWRGQYTIPRELTLQTVNGNLHIAQRPVEEFSTIIDSTRNWSSKQLDIIGEQTIDLEIPFKTGSMLLLNYVFNIEEVQSGRIGLRFGNDLNESISFHFNIGEQTYEFDRSHSGNVDFHPKFAGKLPPINRISNSVTLKGQIILDTSSIEIFADDGLNTVSALFFPTDVFENIQLHGSIDDNGKPVIVQQLTIAALKSIW